MKSHGFHIGFTVQLCLLSVCIVTATAAFFSYQNFQAEATTRTMAISNEALSIARTTAVQLDLQQHQNLFAGLSPAITSPAMPSSPARESLENILAQVRAANNLEAGSSIYALRKIANALVGSEMEVVASAAGGQVIKPMRRSIEPFQLQALQGQAEVSPIYQHHQQMLISAAAPLLLSGEVVGIIQVDRNLDAYFAELTRLKQLYLLYAGICLLLGALAAWVFAINASKPLQALHGAILAVGKGNYQYQIPEDRHDHFGVIFQDLNRMTRKVNRTFEEQLDQVREMASSRVELQESLEYTEKALKAKNEFLANISHEIRTPMTSIIGFTKVLMKRESRKEQTLLLRRVTSASEILMRIVNQILDLSKIQSEGFSLNVENYNLYQELVELVLMNGERTAERHIDLVLQVPRPLPEFVLGDCMRTSEVILNLLSNAIKFTHRGYVKVTVEYEAGPDNALVLMFTVEDTGIGMDEQACRNVFLPFTQADASVAKSYGGTGLGLTIAREISESMDGVLEVSSKPGVGSTFKVSLTQEMGEKPEDYEAPAEVKVDVLLGKRFLVIDQCSAIGELLVSWFERHKISCEFVTDVSGAAALCQDTIDVESSFDGILLGWPMETNDVEFSRQKLLEQGLGDIPLFIMIPFGRLIEFENKYDALIVKPLIHDDVFITLADFFTADEKVEKIIFERRNEDESRQQILSQRRILVVEDNVNNQILVEFLLEDYGVEFDLAENGKLALERMQDTHYDLVLMDVQMPIMDGLTATAHIRETQDKQSMPVVALTANTTPNDCTRIREVGMNDIVSKPVDTDFLYNVLDTYLLSDGERQQVLDKTQGPDRSTVTGLVSSVSTEESDTAACDLDTGDLDTSDLDTNYTDKKILVVDDNVNNQVLVSYALDDLGLEYVMADHGEHAIELLEWDTFDLVLMDMQMPVMDGLTATRTIRANNTHQSLPIIAMTANCSREDEELCRLAGMNGLITKPVDFDRFAKVLDAYLANDVVDPMRVDSFTYKQVDGQQSSL